MKARNPKTIEKAKNIDNTEELKFNVRKETYNLFNANKRQSNNFSKNNNNNYHKYNNKNMFQPHFDYNNNNNRNNYSGQNNNFSSKSIQCYKCNESHFTNRCRSN